GEAGRAEAVRASSLAEYHPLPITHYLLPITHYPLPITHYLFVIRNS
ncbi:MAG: hypothetical protein RLZZ115_3372, partial [Cyanobacteriota bacterium]